MKKIKIGLLPMYIKLYDDLIPSLRDRLEPFYERAAKELEEKGVEVLRLPFCRVEEEFCNEVKNCENAKVNCIVTLHMAYSPSLESEKALTETNLPIVVMDATETYSFGPDGFPDDINFNHGIHGVMDMCNILKRHNKIYSVAAGHIEFSDVVSETVGLVKAAVAANSLAGSKVGVFGGSFAGMGDFIISKEELASRFGVELVMANVDEMNHIADSITPVDVAAEMVADKETFDFPEELNEKRYDINTKACLTIRKWIEKNGLNAFSVNFLQVSPSNGLGSMPFTEACKAMSRGIGYAGEGDALTAAVTGSILQAYPNTSFVEIFCPDWKNNTLLLSHMGEMNYSVADGKPQLRNVSFNYTDAEPPVVGYARFKGGKGVYLNVFKDSEEYKLLIAPVEMQAVEKDNFPYAVRGWMKPQVPVADFLKKLSMNGATHHSILIYDTTVDEMEFFGRLLGMPVIKLD